MTIVIDTNIVFSALLKNKSRFRDIIFSKENTLIAPQNLLKEQMNKFDKILKFSKLERTDLFSLFFEFLSVIHFVDERVIPNETYLEAYSLCCDYDVTDTPFVAMAIHFDARLWTGDKIKEHLTKKGFKNIFEY
ncbi:MAG: PIN domain-containing protein [bacterium]